MSEPVARSVFEGGRENADGSRHVTGSLSSSIILVTSGWRPHKCQPPSNPPDGLSSQRATATGASRAEVKLGPCTQLPEAGSYTSTVLSCPPVPNPPKT